MKNEAQQIVAIEIINIFNKNACTRYDVEDIINIVQAKLKDQIVNYCAVSETE